MANTGYIINPYVRQVFISGPNSGSLVSSSYVRTFDISSSFTSSILFGKTYNYREQNLIDCYVSGTYITPSFTSVVVNNCNDNNYIYNLVYNINDTNLNIPSTQIEYSLFPNFSVYNTTSSINLNNNINSSSLTLSGSVVPLNKQQPVYFRIKNLYSGSFTSSYSGILNTYCPQETIVSNQNASSIGTCSSETMTITGPAFDEITIKFLNINPGDSGYLLTIKNTTTNKILLSKNSATSISDLVLLIPSNGELNLEFKLCANTSSGYVGITFNILDMGGDIIYNFFTQATS